MTASEERNRRNVSVEQLLTWAYRDQRVHEARRGPLDRSSGGGPLAAYSSLWEDSTPIEASRNQGFESAPDAWVVHDHVLALGRYQVDCGHDLAVARYHRLGAYRGAEPPIGRGSVDRSARPWPTDGQLHVDLRALVMIHASRASRPALPGRDPTRLKPGEVVWARTSTGEIRRSKVYAKGMFCHVTAEGDLPGDRIEAWEVFMAWRRALERLRDELKAVRLTLHRISDQLPIDLERPRTPLTGE